MQRSAHVFLCLAFLCLLFCLSTSLVQGPEKLSRAEGRPVGNPLMAIACHPGSSETETGQNLFQSEKIKQSAITESHESLPLLDIPMDGNGYPILGRTWRSAVYLVCPPEGVPG